MTAIEDIKKGDRVRAVNVNGDVAEFTVTRVGKVSLGMGNTRFWAGDGWGFEKIEPPLPTVEGYYVSANATDGELALFRVLKLRHDAWSENAKPLREQDVRDVGALVRLELPK